MGLFFIAALTEISMDIYHLLLTQNDCQIGINASLNQIIQEIYRVLSFYMLIFAITYFFWISNNTINNKIGNVKQSTFTIFH